MRCRCAVVAIVGLAMSWHSCPAAVVDVLRYRLGEPGSYNGQLFLDEIGDLDMTASAGSFTPGNDTDTMNQSYSQNATTFGSSGLSGSWGADSSGLPEDNFGLEIWARVSDPNQTFNNYLAMNGDTNGSITFHAGNQGGSAFGPRVCSTLAGSVQLQGQVKQLRPTSGPISRLFATPARLLSTLMVSLRTVRLRRFPRTGLPRRESIWE
jgi:hypothetical protein